MFDVIIICPLYCGKIIFLVSASKKKNHCFFVLIIEVDEYGSTADFFTDETTQQAESADWPEGRSSHPEVAEFHADHPFIFTVRHNLSGLVLFVGRVCDFPSQNIRHRRQTHAARPSDLVDNLKSTFTGRERRDSR